MLSDSIVVLCNQPHLRNLDVNRWHLTRHLEGVLKHLAVLSQEVVLDVNTLSEELLGLFGDMLQLLVVHAEGLFDAIVVELGDAAADVVLRVAGIDDVDELLVDGLLKLVQEVAILVIEDFFVVLEVFWALMMS